jgi:phosphate transport system permease protein
MSIGLLVLAWILITLIIKGFGALSLNLFTQTTPAPAARAAA